jgi:hypothetical protein
MQHTFGNDTFLVPVWIAALGGFCSPVSAADESTGGNVMEVARSAPGPCSTRALGEPGPVTLLFQPPSGRTMRLTYTLNDGWRVGTAAAVSPQVSDGISPAMIAFRKRPSSSAVLLKDAEEAADLVLQPRRGNAGPES